MEFQNWMFIQLPEKSLHSLDTCTRKAHLRHQSQILKPCPCSMLSFIGLNYSNVLAYKFHGLYLESDVVLYVDT